MVSKNLKMDLPSQDSDPKCSSLPAPQPALLLREHHSISSDPSKLDSGKTLRIWKYNAQPLNWPTEKGHRNLKVQLRSPCKESKKRMFIPQSIKGNSYWTPWFHS